MKIGLRGGHSPNRKGAMGILDEQQSVRDLCYAVKPILEQHGHVVIDCNSNASTVSGELTEGTNKANSNGCDVYVTLHLNAFNGTANGVEALVHDGTSMLANAIAQRACLNLASLGLLNRGVKQRRDLHDLNASNMEAVLIEVLFCDSAKDVGIWQSSGLHKIASLIANAIDSRIPAAGGSTTGGNPVPPAPSPQPAPQPTPKPPAGAKVNMMGQRGPTPNRSYSGEYDASVAELQQILVTNAGYDRAVNGIADEALYQFMCGYTVELNDRGNIIFWAQKRLDILGYNSGGADGYAEQQTMDAIARFQTAYGLGVGYLGGTDWYYMIES